MLPSWPSLVILIEWRPPGRVKTDLKIWHFTRLEEWSQSQLTAGLFGRVASAVGSPIAITIDRAV